jgi:hypothetical protein
MDKDTRDIFEPFNSPVDLSMPRKMDIDAAFFELDIFVTNFLIRFFMPG